MVVFVVVLGTEIGCVLLSKESSLKVGACVEGTEAASVVFTKS